MASVSAVSSFTRMTSMGLNTLPILTTRYSWRVNSRFIREGPRQINAQIIRSFASDVDNTHLDGSPKIYRQYPDGFKVRSMTADDAKIVQKWYLNMGVISRYDLDINLSVMPRVPGYYIGEYDGEVVASAVRVNCADNIFYGSYLYVDPRMRGKGLARRIKNEVAMEYVGSGILTVDAVLDPVAVTNETKLGYKTAWLTGRFSGSPSSFPMSGAGFTGTIKKAIEVDFEQLIQYDNKCYVQPDFRPRRDFLHQWIRIAGGESLVAVDEKSRLVGFGCRRPCIQDHEHLIGPLYADSGEAARALMQQLGDDVRQDSVTINVWYPNEDMMKLLEEFRFEHIFDLKRQHLNGDPREFKPQVYGVTSIDCMGF